MYSTVSRRQRLTSANFKDEYSIDVEVANGFSRKHESHKSLTKFNATHMSQFVCVAISQT